MLISRFALWLALGLTFIAPAARAQKAKTDIPDPFVSALSYDSAVVRLRPMGDRVQIDAIFSFRNDSNDPARSRIDYAFVTDDVHAAPTDFVVYQEGEPVPFQHNKDGSVSFELKAGPTSTISIRALYTQPCTEPYACYPVGNETAWIRKFDHARFEVVAPKGVTIDNISYQGGKVSDFGDETVHAFSYDRPFPKQDLCVHWSSH